MFPKWININICHFLIRLIKMKSYNTYPTLPWGHAEGPSTLPLQSRVPSGPQVGFHLSVIKAKRRGLIDKEKMFKKKYKKYNKILNRLMWLNACSSGISIAAGISSVATFTTFIGLPVFYWVQHL